MRFTHAAWSVCALAVSACSGTAHAAVVWSEAIDGDLSNNRLAPTALVLMPGDNTQMSVELIAPIAMEKGLRFAIREGGRTVGAGTVTEVLE